ncbi:MAG: ATP-dependent helicase [Planctomycetota bacterium]|jgi:DNA helicase-2/ATP-dependent DNA helicase PcrA
MPDYLENLNDNQREAAQHIDGPMLVVAGAGSGKTRVVTSRIAHLINSGINDYNILALTFTNKAAREMAQRVEDMVGPIRALVTTFHSACARWLRYDIESFDCGRSSRFSIYDADDQGSIVKACLKELEEDPKKQNYRNICNAISKNKINFIDPDEALTEAFSPKQKIAAQVYQIYEKKLKESNAVDFDDLLILTIEMLKSNDAILKKYQERYKYILVDEYQDTNRIQYTLLKLLVGNNTNIHATGDPDQSIYSWRGADYRNIMDFQNDYEGTRIVMLEENYRSSQLILNASNMLIQNNENRYDKTLFTRCPEGERVKLCHLSDDRTEAAFVASELKRLLSEGKSYRDAAVFYRVNAQSRSLEEVFMREGIAYSIVGGLRFYERKEIKDLLAYLKCINNSRDGISFRRMTGTPSKGIGAKTLDTLEVEALKYNDGIIEFILRPDFADIYGGRVTAKLKDFRKFCRELTDIPQTPVQSTIEKVIELSGIKEFYKSDNDPRSNERIENIEALVNRAAEFDQINPGKDLPAFLEEVALVADVDFWNDSADAVTLMTIHSAKGLEFNNVFVVGIEDGLLPHKNSLETPAEIEEERRLLYVAMTRAEKRLYLTTAAQRMQWGRIDVTMPSMFIDELPIDEIEETNLYGGDAVAPASLMPNMSGGSYYGRKAPVGQGRRRLLGAGQPRRRSFDDLDDDFFDDLDINYEDEVQEHPEDDFYF